MAIDLFANSAQTTLTAAVTTTPAAGTLETWTVTSTGPFPQIGTAGVFQFRAVVNLFTDSNPEILIVTQILSSSQIQVSRGAENSAIKTHSATDTLSLTITAGAISGMLPSGKIDMFAGSTAPPGWLLCDGSAVSRTTYINLFQAIGTTFGAGDGSTTFNVPDLRGRVIVGVGTGSGLTARTLGQSGGEENHTLVTGEMPGHNHALTDPQHTHGVTDPQHSHSGIHISGQTGGINGWIAYANSSSTEGTSTASIATHASYSQPSTAVTAASATGATIDSAATGITDANTGGGGGHNNMQPYAVLNYIIRT